MENQHTLQVMAAGPEGFQGCGAAHLEFRGTAKAPVFDVSAQDPRQVLTRNTLRKSLREPCATSPNPKSPPFTS